MKFTALIPLLAGLFLSVPAFAQDAPACLDVETASAKDLEALKGVVKFPVRIKCATLSWNTLAQALDEASPIT